MAKLKYHVGMILRHKKHGYVIQIEKRAPFSNVMFRVIKGNIPENAYTWLSSNEGLYCYSVDTIRKNFDILSGEAAKVLFSPQRIEPKAETPTYVVIAKPLDQRDLVKAIQEYIKNKDNWK